MNKELEKLLKSLETQAKKIIEEGKTFPPLEGISLIMGPKKDGGTLEAIDFLIESMKSKEPEAEMDFIFFQEPDGSFRRYDSEEDYINKHDDIYNSKPYTRDIELHGQFNVCPKDVAIHYDFDYSIDKKDIDKGSVRIDPYLVCRVWNLKDKDSTGCLFHMLKNISRMGTKEGNTTQREVDGLYSTLGRFCELNGLTKR